MVGTRLVHRQVNRAPLAGQPPPQQRADQGKGGVKAAHIVGKNDGAGARRRLTGKGSAIDLAMYEACTYHLTASLAQASLTGADPPRRGNGDPAALVQDVYAADGSERWLAVTVSAAQAGALGEMLGCAVDPDTLSRTLARWSTERSAEEGARALQAIGVAAAPVQDARDLLLDPQLRHRESFTLVPHEQPVNGYGAHPHAASAFLFAGRPRPPLHESPAGGQDSRALLRELGGMNDAEIDALVADGVIGVAGPSAGPAMQHADPESARRRLDWRLIAAHDSDPGRTLDLPRSTPAHSAVTEVRA